jgi:hypothetical protein
VNIAAAIALALGLVASAYAGMLFAHRAPTLAAFLNLICLLPGLALMIRGRLRQTPSALAWAPVYFLMFAVMVHSLTFLAPVVKAYVGSGVPEIVSGADVFGESLFSLAGTAHMPWWIANLAIALIPFIDARTNALGRIAVAAGAAFFAIVGWLPLIDYDNDLWRAKLVRSAPLQGLYLGYYAWAWLISAVSLFVIAGAYVGGAQGKKGSDPFSKDRP